MPTCDILVGKALWMLRREHVYWFYCCNWHHQNVSGMQPQAIEHCAIPATLSLFKFYITCLFHKGGLQKNNSIILVTNSPKNIHSSSSLILSFSPQPAADDLVVIIQLATLCGCLSALTLLSLRMTCSMKHGNSATDFMTT